LEELETKIEEMHGSPSPHYYCKSVGVKEHATNQSCLKATRCFSWQNTKAKFADSSNATKKLCSILKKNGMTNGELNVL
jgi:hypothetical protein